jgi:hypothetical protein
MKLLVLGLLASAVLLPGLGLTDLRGSDEPRYAQAAREMRQSGDYVHLTVNGRPYAKKPPVLMWLQAAAAGISGSLDEREARLPSALAGIGVVLLTYLLVPSSPLPSSSSPPQTARPRRPASQSTGLQPMAPPRLRVPTETSAPVRLPLSR